MQKPKISIIGLGYVGLCTAVAFSSRGFSIVAVDVDKKKVDMINNGKAYFYEPQIDDFLKKSLKDNLLYCTLNQIQKAVLNSEITFIAVGTPSKKNGSIDLKYIKQVTKQIAKALKNKKTYHLIVVKSTVTPQTTNTIIKNILEKYSNKRCGVDFGLCMNPEFLRQGSAIKDTMNPDRIILGADDQKSANMLENLYKQFYRKNTPPIIKTTTPTAELCKYASNSFLATKISYINTIANICQKIPNTNIGIVAKAMGFDNRISPKFLRAGIGYGGSCFPKDIKALIIHSKKLNYKSQLLESVDKININQPLKAIELLQTQIKDLKQKQIAILGLSFKPNTDDMREAPSIIIINDLLEKGAKITVYDPKATTNAKKIFVDKIQYAKSPIECIKNKDACIIVTEWSEIKKLKTQDFKKNMKTPIIIDGRRILDFQEFKKETTYITIGQS